MQVISLVMAGGKAERLGGVEKPVIKVCGNKTMVETVVDVAKAVSSKVFVSLSPHNTLTREVLRRVRDVTIINAGGRGYVEDLRTSLRLISNYPVLTLPADMPFLTRELLLGFISEALSKEAEVVTLTVGRGCPRLRRGPRGVALFKAPEGRWANVEMCRYPELLDVDTWDDLKEARKLCRESMEASG